MPKEKKSKLEVTREGKSGNYGGYGGYGNWHKPPKGKGKGKSWDSTKPNAVPPTGWNWK